MAAPNSAEPFLSRRWLLTAGAGLLAAPAFAADDHAQGHGAPSITPDAALTKLLAGNGRFVAAKSLHPNLTAQRRHLVAAGQHPFATVLTCADSRVPPELIFDQGLGDLFVIRVAGNVIDDVDLASIEYSVIHTGSPLVMVLGHERCGAVQATVDALAGHGSPEDKDTHIGALANLIAPAVRAVPAGAPDKLDAAVVINAQRAATEVLKGSRPLAERVRAHRLRIVSARYDLDDGKVGLIRDAVA